MDVDLASNWLQQIAAYGTQSVGFTGGEPFYCWEKLLSLANTATRLGLTHTVVTNGFWADSKQRALSMLAQLSPSDVSVSTDVYHAEHIPIEHIAHVFAACQALDIRCDVSLTYDLVTIEQTRSLVRRLLGFVPPEAIHGSRIFPFGRGESLRDLGSTECKKYPPSFPCLFASVPYILPSGDVRACVGPAIDLPSQNNPLCLGSLHERSITSVFEASQANPILHGLRMWGPLFWHRLVEKHSPRSALPERYSNDYPCQACVALLQQPQVSAFLSRATSSKALGQYVGQARRVLLNEAIA